MTGLREAALSYAAAGARVFPCQPRGKRPITGNGLLAATSDPDVIAAWWRETPSANIAIRPSDTVIVVDIDPRNGGDRTIGELQERHGKLPVTRTVRTGGGGWHYYLGLRGKVLTSLGAGVDVKTSRGYLIAPPSVHESGRRYEWINDGPIAPAPEWLVSLLTPPPPRPESWRPAGGSSRRAERLAETVAQARPGQRNSTLHWACCRAAEAGLDLNPLIDAGVAAGLSEAEAFRTALSATRTVGVA